MFFASPLWLMGLLPWAAATMWLLLARRDQVRVPFVRLWHGTVRSSHARAAISAPPPAVLLAILALLIAVMASAGLGIRTSAPDVTIIVDRGITMSARYGGTTRFIETCNQLGARLIRGSQGNVKLISVPGGETWESDRHQWFAIVRSMKPTTMNTVAELRLTAQRQAAQSASNVIVVSDQPVEATPGIIQIEPLEPASNLTIANLAARSTPHAQVMVVLRDQNSPTDARRAMIHVNSAGNSATQQIDVPRDSGVTAFIDLPRLGPIVSVDVEAADDLDADNHALLARENSAAVVDDLPTLPPALRRMTAVYNRHRAGDGKHIAVVTDAKDLPENQPGVVFATDTSPISPAELHVAADPLTANIDWPTAAADAGGSTAPDGFTPLVYKGPNTFLARRDGPAPAIWVCLNGSHFASDPGYVILWTNIFDALGGETIYRWHPADAKHPPGIEKSSDGSLRAFNAINVSFPAIKQNDWSQLQHMKESPDQAVDLSPWACVLAIVLMLAAMLLGLIRN
jgi:hypothetical protein